jgi:hypothetical protein
LGGVCNSFFNGHNWMNSSEEDEVI